MISNNNSEMAEALKTLQIRCDETIADADVFEDDLVQADRGCACTGVMRGREKVVVALATDIELGVDAGIGAIGIFAEQQPLHADPINEIRPIDDLDAGYGSAQDLLDLDLEDERITQRFDLFLFHDDVSFT